MSKFYESDEFKKLRNKWNYRLKKSGFDDIETNSGILKKYHKLFFYTHYNSTTAAAKETYYRLAGQFLHEYIFKNDVEKKIWEYHVQGFSQRKIDKIMKKKKSYAEHVIKRLKLALRRHFFKTENEDD